MAPDIENAEELKHDGHGRLWLEKRYEGGAVSVVPLTWSSLNEYAGWIERNVQYLPEGMIEIAKVLRHPEQLSTEESK
jgi:hypothetical protein